MLLRFSKRYSQRDSEEKKAVYPVDYTRATIQYSTKFKYAALTVSFVGGDGIVDYEDTVVVKDIPTLISVFSDIRRKWDTLVKKEFIPEEVESDRHGESHIVLGDWDAEENVTRVDLLASTRLIFRENEEELTLGEDIKFYLIPLEKTHLNFFIPKLTELENRYKNVPTKKSPRSLLEKPNVSRRI